MPICWNIIILQHIYVYTSMLSIISLEKVMLWFLQRWRTPYLGIHEPSSNDWYRRPRNRHVRHHFERQWNQWVLGSMVVWPGLIISSTHISFWFLTLISSSNISNSFRYWLFKRFFWYLVTIVCCALESRSLMDGLYEHSSRSKHVIKSGIL